MDSLKKFFSSWIFKILLILIIIFATFTFSIRYYENKTENEKKGKEAAEKSFVIH